MGPDPLEIGRKPPPKLRSQQEWRRTAELRMDGSRSTWMLSWASSLVPKLGGGVEIAPIARQTQRVTPHQRSDPFVSGWESHSNVPQILSCGNHCCRDRHS